MNEDLEKKLVEKFPKLYRDYHGDIMVTCMGWGSSAVMAGTI